MFDSRRILFLGRGISVLIGGANLNGFFALRGGNLKKPIFKSSNALGGVAPLPGEGGGQFDRYK